MILMMTIVDLVGVKSSLGWRGWCYHGHGQAKVSNLVIRIVIIICWWSDFVEEFSFIMFGYNWKVGRTEWVSPKVENFGKLSDHGPRCDDDSLWKLSSNPTLTILQEFMITDRVRPEKNMFHIAAWNKFRWHPFHCLKSVETFQRCLRENARMATVQIFLLKRGIGRDWR